MLKNVLQILVIFVFGMAGGIFADQIFWPYFVERPLFYEYRLDKPPIYVAETREIIIQENVALQEAVQKVEKAVVGVRTRTTDGRVLKGSGLMATSDGLLVTLAQLVPAGGSTFTFFAEGKALPYQVLKRDLENNLALVKLEGANFTTVDFADFSKLRLGERVFLLGAAHPLNGGKVANEGIVRALGENSIQTNISENQGLQGSPLFNIEGQLLGLVSVAADGSVQALPVPQIRAFLGL